MLLGINPNALPLCLALLENGRDTLPAGLVRLNRLGLWGLIRRRLKPLQKSCAGHAIIIKLAGHLDHFSRLAGIIGRSL